METALKDLERLATLAEEAGLRTVAAELREERIPALESGTLSVVVLGEFNHGKSSLINALLKASILPVGITPTTAVITRIGFGEEPTAVASFDDGRTQELKLEELDSVVREYDEAVQEVVVRHSLPLLAERVVLVDTPGVNDISQQKVEVTYGVVPRADIVVFVLDATQVLKRTELRFIEKRLLTGLRDRLVFVLNKIDRLDADEAEEVESYARQRLDSILGSVEIFPVSARRALESGDPGFDRLRDHLLAFLREQRDWILLDSALGTGLRSGGALLGTIRIKRRSYQLGSEELLARVQTVQGKLRESRRAISRNVEHIDEAVGNLAATARHNIAKFRDSFLAALPREIEKASGEDVKRYLPDFIEDCFRNFLESEGASIARALENLAEDVITVTNENLRIVDALQQEFGLDPESVDIKVDSKAYDFSVFALGAFGVSVLVFVNALVGGLIALATPVLAFVLRDRLETRLKQRATETGLEAIREASTRIQDEFVKMIDDFGVRLKRFVEDAGDRLYRQIEDALQTAMDEKQEAGADTGRLDIDAARIESAVREILARVEERRGGL